MKLSKYQQNCVLEAFAHGGRIKAVEAFQAVCLAASVKGIHIATEAGKLARMMNGGEA